MNKYVFLTNSLLGGGAEKVICLLSTFLSDGNSAIIVKIDPKPSSFEISSNVKIYSLSNNLNYKSIYRFIFFPIYIYRFYKILKKYTPDFSISFLPIPNFINVLTNKIIFRNRSKIVVNERCFPSKAYSNNFLRLFTYKVLIAIFYNMSDFVFANSKKILLDLKKNFFLKKNGHVFNNPIGFKVKDQPKKLVLNSKIKILMIGRLTEVKGYDVALKSFNSLLKYNSNYELHIFGDGNLRSSVLKQIDELNIKDFVFLHGFKRNIKNVLINFDIFLMTSRSEGFPNALIEAMAVGIPVISTNCQSGPSEILNVGNSFNYTNGFKPVKYGVLTEVDNIKGITNSLIYLSDKKNYSRYSELSIKRAKFYDDSFVFNEFLKVINE